MISQASSSEAPPSATMGSVRPRFSPWRSATRLGTTSPMKGIAPTTITLADTVTATSTSPSAAVAA